MSGSFRLLVLLPEGRKLTRSLPHKLRTWNDPY